MAAHLVDDPHLRNGSTTWDRTADGHRTGRSHLRLAGTLVRRLRATGRRDPEELAPAGGFPPWAAGLGRASRSPVVVLDALRIDRRSARPLMQGTPS